MYLWFFVLCDSSSSSLFVLGIGNTKSAAGTILLMTQLLIWFLAKLNCPLEITLEKEFEFYETKTDNLNIYPNGIISFDSTLQEFYNSLQNNDDGDTFATIVVPYYKGKNLTQYEVVVQETRV